MSTTGQRESLFGSVLSAYHFGRRRGDSMGQVGVMGDSSGVCAIRGCSRPAEFESEVVVDGRRWIMLCDYHHNTSLDEMVDSW